MSYILTFSGPRFGSANINSWIATKQEDVDESIKSMLSNTNNHKRLIGLDLIKTRAKPGEETPNAILQLCDSSQCLIVRLNAFDSLPESLYNFLSFPGFTFAGFGIKDTMAKLEKAYGLVCKNVLEVGTSEWWNFDHGSHRLAGPIAEELRSMEKPVWCITDAWFSGRELTRNDVIMAISNAYFAFRRIGNQMLVATNY